MATTASVRFYDCGFDWSPIFEWQVSYPAGSMTFDLQITVPRHPVTNDWYPLIVVGARGVHQGVAWTQDDPLNRTTVANALWHEYTIPEFATLFPEPIDGACGIATGFGTRMVEEWFMGFPEVYTFDCDHQRLAEWEADSP